MIRVTVELVPFGVERLKSTMATVYVGNVGGSAGKGKGNYAIWLNDDPRGPSDYPEMHSVARIEDRPRDNNQEHVVGLAGEALRLVQEARDNGKLATGDWTLTSEQMAELAAANW